MLINGAAIGLEEIPGLLFKPTRPNCYCRICGAVFQSDYDRNPEWFKNSIEFCNSVDLVSIYATSLRKEWSIKHSRSHTDAEHRHLALSGQFLLPEAAHKLAAFGVVDVKGMVMDKEIEAAYAEAPAIPQSDAEV